MLSSTQRPVSAAARWLPGQKTTSPPTPLHRRKLRRFYTRLTSQTNSTFDPNSTKTVPGPSAANGLLGRTANPIDRPPPPIKSGPGDTDPTTQLRLFFATLPTATPRPTPFFPAAEPACSNATPVPPNPATLTRFFVPGFFTPGQKLTAIPTAFFYARLRACGWMGFRRNHPGCSSTLRRGASAAGPEFELEFHSRQRTPLLKTGAALASFQRGQCAALFAADCPLPTKYESSEPFTASPTPA
ncbi:MAG: hypothetical protein FOGNACKC_05612 [Anaerolineae bacterium]|nr:hypothetical protein [Anaerolineae bacterium]